MQNLTFSFKGLMQVFLIGTSHDFVAGFVPFPALRPLGKGSCVWTLWMEHDMRCRLHN